VTYGGLYVGTLGAMYAGVTCDLIQPPESLPVDRGDMYHPPTDFAKAWILTKFTEPLRLAATVAVVPRISRARRAKAR
jgi:hypothetical protein